MTSIKPFVGLQFLNEIRLPWNDRGQTTWEAATYSCTVTAVEGGWVRYRVDEFLDVEDPCPLFKPIPAGADGGMVREDRWNHYVDVGHIHPFHESI